MRMIGTLLVAAVPLVGIFGLLWLSDRLRARGETRRLLQITVTDAVHGALGAVAAPVVTRHSRPARTGRVVTGSRHESFARRSPAGSTREY